MPVRLLAAVAVVAFMAGDAGAQDRQGRNTPGEWKVTHFQTFGLWDSMCDERKTGQQVEQRCYVRYVEVYSPQPQFGAAFAFIVPEGRDGPVTAEFGFERGIRFKDGGFRIESGGETVWFLEDPPCARGGACDLDSDAMAKLETLLAETEDAAFAFSLTGRYGKDWDLRWESGELHAAIGDMRVHARERDLID
jgi:hypothetical protein